MSRPAATATPASSRSTSSGSARSSTSCSPRALLLANLFRDQLDRYGELDSIADRWAAVVGDAPPARARPQRRRPDGRRPRARPWRRHRTSGCRTTRWPCRRCSTPPTPSTAGAAARRTSTTPSTSATSAATTATAAARRAPTRRSRPSDVVLEGVRGARFTLRTPAGDARRSRCPCPGSTTSTTRSAPPRWRSRWARRSTTSSPGCRPSPPPSGAPRRCASPVATCPILLVKNPAGANEVLRTLTLEDGEHDVFAVLNDNIADGRDVSWVWDADFEVLAPRVRRATCSGTRAAEMALRLKYAGVPVDRIAVEPELGAGLDRALRAGDGPLFALPTYTAMLALRDLLRARAQAPRAGARSDDRGPDGPLARPRVRRPTTSTCRCGASWPTARARPVLDVGAGTGRVALDLARRGHEVVALDLEPGAARRAARRAPRGPARCTDRRGRRARRSTSAAASRSSSCRCRRCSSSAAPTAARASCAARASTWRPGGAARRGAGRRAGMLRRGARPAAAARPARGRRRDLRQPAGQRCATSATARPSSASARSSRATAPARPSEDVVELDRLDARGARAEEAVALGLRAGAPRRIPQTLEYVGSTVVMLRG